MTDCPICFDVIDFQGNNCVKTECGHEFHNSCLMMSALQESRANHGFITGFKCPYCRQFMCQSAAPAPRPAPMPALIPLLARVPPPAPRPAPRPAPVQAPPPEPRNGQIRRSPTATGRYRIGEVLERFWHYRGGWVPSIVKPHKEGGIYISPVSIEVFNKICTRCQERGHDKDKCFVNNLRSTQYDLANPTWCKRCGCTRSCGIGRKQGQPASPDTCRSTNKRGLKYDQIHNLRNNA